MVQSMSMSTIINPGSSGLYGSNFLSRRETARRSQLLSGYKRHSLWNDGVQNLSLRGKLNNNGQQNLRVEAGWLFKGGGGNEKCLDASIEQNESANEDVLVFFFQLDLATRVQGVICGMDPVCCESSSWMEKANVQSLSNGSNQPFYQVLVDVHEDPDLLVAYVPEENLLVPEKPNLVSKPFSSEKGYVSRYVGNIYLSWRFHPNQAAAREVQSAQARSTFRS